MIEDPRHWPAFAMLLAAPALLPARVASQAPAPRTAAPASRAVEAEWVEIERVVDGDTIHVRRAGKIEKLRLVSVDTEERLGKGHSSSPTKPQTVFGEECAIWAGRVFGDLDKVGLVFPGGSEARDVYGRLLCRVLLPDGTDYNLMLVELGKSPYFNKYGNDLEDHAAFVSAQDAARKAQLGIWNPATNEAKTPGAPSAKRPYGRLLPWWDARAAAVDAYRERAAKEPGAVADAEDAASLARAARSGHEVDVFGEVDRLFDESDGSRTVLFRSSDKDKALRVRIPLSTREAHGAFGWKSVTRDFRQNYVWVRGRVEESRRGFTMLSADPARWRLAGPQPGPPAAPSPR